MKTNIFSFLLLCATVAHGQSSLTAKAFVTEDHDVLIRFAPVDKASFDLGIKYGYKIERVPCQPNGQDPSFSNSTTLTTKPLMPLAMNDTSWVQLIRKEPNTAFVYQSIYSGGKSKSTTNADKIKAEQSSFGLVLLSCDLSLNISKAVGLFFKDSSAAPGTYAYKIGLMNAPSSAKFQPVIVAVDSRTPTLLKNISGVTGKFGDRIVKLSWNTSENREDYTAYIIERSEDSIHFVRVNKTPYVQLYSEFEKSKTNAFYTDTLPQNGKYYWYRIKGQSHFGTNGPPSSPIKGKGKESLGVFPIADSSSVNGNKVTLYWRMPDGFDLKKLKGFAITRSDKTNGKYEPLTQDLLASSSKNFIDVQPHFSNYYLIYAINQDDDSTHSYPMLAQLRDADPPTPPSGLKGTIDPKGIVTLNWDPNKENDLKGYRVFRCNSLTEEFTEVTTVILTNTSFRDSITLQTLTKDVYYSVTAVDRVFNNSKFAAPLLLKRPDVIPPVPPLFKSAMHTQNSILLQWIPSSSKDVVRYELYRSDAPLTLLKKWDTKDTLRSYFDTLITQGNTYTYTLTVYDDAGNKASAQSPSVFFETGVRGKLKDVTYKVDRNAKTITLDWKNPEKDVFSYVIYKGKKGDALRIWKTVKGNVNTITDKELYISNIYIYKIKAVLNNGSESELSDAVEVNY